MTNLELTKAYYNYINQGEFGEDTYFKLFAADVEIFYPKFGFGKGREGIDNFTKQIKQVVNSLAFDLEKFNFIEKDNYVIVEGHEYGQSSNGITFPNHNTSFGKFASVFEFKGHQIIRMHSYVDPDLAGQDAYISNLLKAQGSNSTEEQITRATVIQFYDILLGKTKGDILDLFTEGVDWDIPGNEEKFPWLGKKTTKQEVEKGFLELHPLYVEPKSFIVDFIAVDGVNATAVGYLSSKIMKSDQVFESPFVAIFKVIEGKITKYHFLEDSYKLDQTMI